MTATPPTIATTLATAITHLKQAEQVTDSPSLDAQILLGHILKKTRAYLLTWPEKPLQPEQVSAFQSLLSQRLQGHPIAHLTGYKEFWGLQLKVTPSTLIPRPDTETLVEVALEKLHQLNQTHPKVLDLGTGTGAIICALKQEMPHIHATAIDLQTDALTVAKENAQTHHLSIEFKQGNWLTPVEHETFDLIVSNPPYIEHNDPHLTQGDVRFDPLTALTSGKTGLEDIQTLIKTAKPNLKAQAWLILEHGFKQALAVSKLFKNEGYINIQTQKDYQNHPRVTFAQWNPQS